MIFSFNVPTGETGTSLFGNNSTDILQSSTSSSSSNWPAFRTEPNGGLFFGQQTQQQPPTIGTIGGLFGTTASFTGTFGGGISAKAIATRKLKRKSCFGTNDTGPIATTSTSSGAVQTGTTINVVAKFIPPIGSDSMLLNRKQTPVSTKLMCIAGMAEYKDKSLEELRLQDYLAGKRVAINFSITAQQQPQQAGAIADGLFSSPLAFDQSTTGGGHFRGRSSGETSSVATTITTTATAAPITSSSTIPSGLFETVNPPAVDVGSIAWPSGDFLFSQQEQPLVTGGFQYSALDQRPEPYSILGEQPPQQHTADAGTAPSTTNYLESVQVHNGNDWLQLVRDSAKNWYNDVAYHFCNIFAPSTMPVWAFLFYMLYVVIVVNNELKQLKASYGKDQPCLANLGNASWNSQGVSESAVFVDGLTAVNIEGPYHTNVRTREPFSMLDAMLDARQCRPIFYFELLIQKNKEHIDFGLSGPDFRLSADDDNWVGKQSDSYGISSTGTLSQAGVEQKDYGEKFGEGDIVGCGLLLLVEGRQLRRQLFFTKNGRIYGKPIWLPKDVSSSLYPIVGLAGIKSTMTAVEANFGDNLALKPFRYDWATHDTGNNQ